MEISTRIIYDTVSGLTIYVLDYINGSWLSTNLSKSQYYYFNKLNDERKYKLFQKWFKSKEWV